MVRKMLLLFCLITTVSLSARSQTVVFINSGSRAAWGNQQQLLIDAGGNARYYLREVNGPVKDSIIFILSALQLQSFFEKAETSGFFTLNTSYDGGAVDGAGIYISLNKSGRKHSVSLVNTDVPAINELIRWLNSLLEPQKIVINYGQFVQSKRR